MKGGTIFHFVTDGPEAALALAREAAGERDIRIGGKVFQRGAQARWNGRTVPTEYNSPLQVTIWVKQLRTVDFTLGYEVRSVTADPESRPAVIAETQLAAFAINEQQLVRLSPQHREYLQRWLRD